MGQRGSTSEEKGSPGAQLASPCCTINKCQPWRRNKIKNPGSIQDWLAWRELCQQNCVQMGLLAGIATGDEQLIPRSRQHMNKRLFGSQAWRKWQRCSKGRTVGDQYWVVCLLFRTFQGYALLMPCSLLPKWGTEGQLTGGLEPTLVETETSSPGETYRRLEGPQWVAAPSMPQQAYCAIFSSMVIEAGYLSPTYLPPVLQWAPCRQTFDPVWNPTEVNGIVWEHRCLSSLISLQDRGPNLHS